MLGNFIVIITVKSMVNLQCANEGAFKVLHFGEHVSFEVQR